jgi:heptosyltransferase-3
MTYGDYPDLRGVKRVLVMKLRHLGDVLLTAPVFTHLKKALPEAQLDAYIYREAVPMLEGHPAISTILGYDRQKKKLGWASRTLYEWSLLREIRKNGYDLVINLTEGDRGAMAARCSGAKIRVGVDQRKVYTHVAKNCKTLRHTVERQLDVLRRIGLFPEEGERGLYLSIPDEARAAMQEKVPWDRFILIHPTSRWRFKCWPMEKVRALAKLCIERGERLVFTSGPDPFEVAMVEEVLKGLDKTRICNLAGLIALKELAALIERTTALLCVDSVPLHMASACKTPTLALFGPTSEVTWGPWQNPRARVLFQEMSCRPCYLDGCGGSKRSDCLETLSVNRVFSELEVIAQIKAPGLRVVH